MSYLKFGVAIVFAFLLLYVFPSHALPTIAEYGKLPAVSMMVISASGERVAFRRAEGEKDFLIVYSLKDKKMLRAIDIASIDPHYMYFVDDTNLIFVVSKYRRIDGFRGTHNVSTAYRFNVITGDLDQLLTPGLNIYTGQTGLGDIVGVSPDGKYVYMPAFVGDKYTQNPRKALMKVNLAKPRKLKEVAKGRNYTIDYFVNTHGEVIAEERYDNRKNLHQVRAKKGKKWEVIFERETDIVNASIAGVTADGHHLVILEEASSNDRTGYYLLSLEDGSITPTKFGRSDKDVERLYTDINRIVYGVRYSGFSPSYHFFDEGLNQFIEDLTRRFSDHSVWLYSWSSNWDKVVIKVEGSQHAGDFFIADRKGGINFVAASLQGIKADDVQPIGTFAYKAEDGLTIPTLLTIPSAKVAEIKNLPAVIMPHGGPESYDRIGFDFLAQALASRGYLVVQPQFRGSDGFGGEFVRAGYGEWGRKMQSDISDGVKHLVERGMIDPERVCIVGWSYGGYAALAGGAFTPDLYQCIVSINGVSDLPRMLKTEKRDHGSDSWVISYWERAMANGEVSKESLREISPAYYAEAFKAPVLLIHGERDKVVPIKQSKVMRSRLERAGKTVEFIKAEDDTHGLIDGANRVKAVEAMVEFVQKHI